MKNTVILILFLAMLFPNKGWTQNHSYLIKNANIFDGKSPELLKGYDVLVVQNVISKIGKSLAVSKEVEIIEAKGYTLTPGFIDCHVHLMFQLSSFELLYKDEFYHALKGAKAAEIFLQNGFTTVRDVGGNTFSLKMLIDNGDFSGPRIYPSGPMISQTAGHADHRFDNEPWKSNGGRYDRGVKEQHMMIADGEENVLRGVREVLKNGASQIKIAGGGGTGSRADPLDVLQYTPKEIRAAVAAAKDWGTYVTSHIYNSKGIRRAIDNGVRCIEHGNLLDKSTLQYMKEKGVWLSPQVSAFTFYPNGYTTNQKKKHDQAYKGLDNLFKNVKKIGFEKIVFGTDMVLNVKKLYEVNKEFEYRSKWFSNLEILQQATSKAGELMRMTGLRNPYPKKLGVIEEGAYADILLIKGNPLQDISILVNSKENIVLIMKGGAIFKKTI